MAPHLRRAAAAARELLLDLAAKELNVDRASLAVADGKVVSKEGGEGVPFGKLTQGQKLAHAVSANAPVTPVEQWKVAGQSVPKADGRAFVSGKHRYTTDMRLPGMLHGRVLRPSAFGAELTSLDTKAAEAMPGVVVVRDGSFAGVAAPTAHAAEQALRALKAEWKTTPQVSGKELWEHFKRQGANPAQGGRGGGHQAGSIKEGMESAEARLSGTYTLPYIAHAPLEPRAALAQWEGGKLTVWTGTQRPFGVRGELAAAFRIPETDIRVIVPDTGSGYGGKHTGEAAVEAARLARAAGKPVKVVWTREEEFTWAYFRPAALIEVSSGARKDGTLTAWEFHNYNSGGSGIRTLYAVPHQLIQFHPAPSPLRQGSYRALAATANHFARECHMDELAHAVGMDPLQFRLKNLQEPRLRAVLEAAAQRFGWGKKAPDGRGFGLACGFEKGGYVATCAEVEIDRDRRIRVVRAVTAFGCGAVLNPLHLENQIEGCVVMGLGAVLSEAIDFEDGRVLNPRFSRYRVPRFHDAPVLETVLVDRKDLPSAGAGETPIVGIGPAVANAVFAATGERLRSLPLKLNGSAPPRS
jgi:isoquinoline 1-oxidoreductase